MKNTECHVFCVTSRVLGIPYEGSATTSTSVHAAG